MFTKNFYKMLITDNYYPQNQQPWQTISRVLKTDGVTQMALNGDCYGYKNAIYNFKVLRPDVICFGDSDIAPTLDQYNIQGNQITFTNSSFTIHIAQHEDEKVEIGIVFRGTPENNSVIKEIALLKNAWQTDNETPAGQFMIYRESLEPINVTAGEEVCFLFKIVIDWT